ncbi:MAG: hypothetical protein IJD16_07895 [Desulfovibrio sp.]|nr:hypothetical protein [Desulfovibrio sp.]
MKADSIRNVVNAAGRSKAHLAELQAGFRHRLALFRRNRSQEDQAALTDDFSRVLEAWGIDDGEMLETIWTLRMRCWIFLVPILYFGLAACLIQDIASLLALLFVGTPCLLGIITTAWRLSVLNNRRFLPLSRWLLSFARRSRKRPQAGGGVSV